MNTHFSDYYWKMGKPYGMQPVSPSALFSYKIVTDPYHKRYSIEKYQQGRFEKIIYDSHLLDFRHLKPSDQLAWQRDTLSENSHQSIFLIRNAEDRIILLETQFFEKNWCKQCVVQSVHGIHLSTHRMYYKAFNDPFDGVILYDAENRPIMAKLYETDPITGEFTHLLVEEWHFQESTLLSQIKDLLIS